MQMSNPAETNPKNKIKLTKESIIDSAMALIEEHGIDRFSLRKLAQKLNCEAMSIYYHVKNKEQIFAEILDRLILKIVFNQSINGTKNQLKDIAHQWRRLSQQYPNIFLILAVHPLDSEIGQNFMHQILLILQQTNLSAKQASHFLRVLNYYLIGAGIDEAKGYHHAAQKQPPNSAYPLLNSAMAFWTVADQDQIFELGLDTLLSYMPD